MRPLWNSNIVVADIFCDCGCIAAGQGQHVISHVHLDDLPFGVNYLRGNEANISGATTEIQDGFVNLDMLAWVAATVVALDNLIGNGFEVFRVIIDRATKRIFLCLYGGSVTFPDRCFACSAQSPR